MSIANEIQRLQQAKADIADAIVAKGGEVSGTLDTYAQAIEALPSGSVDVIAGEVTVTSKSTYLNIYKEVPSEPFLVAVEAKDFVGDVNEVIGSYFFNIPKSENYRNVTFYKTSASANATMATATRTKSQNQFRFYSGNSTYQFLGTYKFKLYINK